MPALRVTTGSRLHFGLTAFGRTSGRQYGGVGCMVEKPANVVEVRSAEQLQVRGVHRGRVQDWAQKLAGALGSAYWEIEVKHSAGMHAGLGTGTQLALAVAAGATQLVDGVARPVAELARLVGRAARSAIGTHGFERGGLIYDLGKTADEPVGVLAERIELRAEWRFLLIRPRSFEGVSGEREAAAFREMVVSPAMEAQLVGELSWQLLPAARLGEFDRFAASLYRYNRLAGECYATWQGSAYAAPILERLVAKIRDLGHAGVGQSSWGPTLFVVLPNESSANELAAQLQRDEPAADLELTVTAPRTQGATIELW